ncbi:hypothetical protein CO151_01430 [bacterium CG_4_9_14_3_um_filter_65_15]|nr:MAG: hypothetical protein CO151_01430 [bacterium CG_4_9_14_3_um_filter_65_15]
MKSGYRIAAVSFLNTIPLLEGLADRTGVCLDVDLPSRLAGRLRDGSADAALVPVAEVLAGRTGGIISPTGIACDGPVDSVILFAPGDPGELNRVSVDRGSRSSVALLRILLTELHHVQPEFVEVEPRPGQRLDPGEGILIIGDRCFAQMAALKGENPGNLIAHDLGAMWKNLTGLPFVFAAWAAAPDLVARRGLDAACELGDLLTAARDRGLARLDEIAAEQAAAGRLGRGGEASPEAIAYYYRKSLRFVLDERARRGMERFRELARIHEVIPAGPAPLWLCRGAEHAD